MNPENLYAMLQNRATCRNYLPDPIPDEVMDRILKAGISSPAASNFQHFSIVKVTDSAARAKLAKLSRNQGFIAKAPVSLIFCFDYHRAMQVRQIEPMPMEAPDNITGFWMGVADVSIVAQTIAIAAEAEGLQSCFNGNIVEVADQVDQLLNLPQHVAPAIMLTLGYPKARRKQPPKYSASLMVHDNTYQEHPSEEVFEAYRKHNNDQKMPPKPEVVEQICRTAAELHGEAYAETIRQDIEKKGYVGPYQYWMGAYYLAGEDFLDGKRMREYFAGKGFRWLEQ